jgi:hypothetical protein
MGDLLPDDACEVSPAARGSVYIERWAIRAASTQCTFRQENWSIEEWDTLLTRIHLPFGCTIPQQSWIEGHSSALRNYSSKIES